MPSSSRAARESGEQQARSDRSYYTRYATSNSRNSRQDDRGRFWKDLKTTRPSRALPLMAIIAISGLLFSGCRTSSLISLQIFSVSYNSQYNTDSTDNKTLSDIFSLAMNDSSASSLQEVRAGYLGVCARTDPMPWSSASDGPSLTRTLRDTNVTDPLALIVYAEKFRNEAVTVIFLYISLICSSVSFTLELFLPRASPIIEMISRTPTESNIIWQSAGFVRPFTLSATCFFSLNSAMWLHLASASAVSMTSTLSFGAVNARSGQTAIALSWLNFVLAAAVLMIGFVKRGNEKYYYVKTDLGDAEPRRGGAGNAGEDGNTNVENEGENIEMTEQEPGAGYHHAQAYNNFIQTLQFLFGQDEFVVKQRHTANWVQRDTMNQGYAETIHEEGQG